MPARAQRRGNGQPAALRGQLQQGRPRPRDRYRLRRRRRDRRLQADQAGQRPGRDRARQGLPPGTLDPLAALLRVRAWLDQAPEGAELALSVFDGRKRYDATLRYLGLTQVADDGGSAPAHRVAMRYQLVSALNEDTGKLEPEQAVAAARDASSRSAPTAATCRCAWMARWTACRSRRCWPATAPAGGLPRAPREPPVRLRRP